MSENHAQTGRFDNDEQAYLANLSDDVKESVLQFLNTATSAEELAAAIEFSDDRDIGLKMAGHLIERRAALEGKFSNLEEIASLKNIGPARLHDIVSAAAYPHLNERTNFRNLMLANPNYFGTLPGFGTGPVLSLSSNRTYEELCNIGLKPEDDKLEAVVLIKRNNGYISGACSGGSTEYVRFFLERMGTWVDLGVKTFTAYNLPGSPVPISYSVEMDMAEVRRLCKTQNLVKVRGILSWNFEPTAGNANFVPVWGNIVDVTVQIAARRLPILSLGDLVKDKFIEIKPDILASFDLSKPLVSLPEKPLNFDQLKSLYAETRVPNHRYGLTEALKYVDTPLSSTIFDPRPPVVTDKVATGVATMSAAAVTEIADGTSNTVALAEAPTATALADFDTKLAISAYELADILKKIKITVGNTTYEQLTCAGYNPATHTLSGVINVKLSSGYSGGLCGLGSTEYVKFWVFYAGSWHSLGTATVKVHDLTGLGGGNTVQYSVYKLATMPELPCHDLTGLPLRAILSWNVAPDNNPNFAPTWGNVVNTHIQPSIGVSVTPGTFYPQIRRLNKADVDRISDVSGLFNRHPADPVIGWNVADRPFGGPVHIQGYFVNKFNLPDYFDNNGNILAGAHPMRYKVFVSSVGSASLPRTQISNAYGLAFQPEDGSSIKYFNNVAVTDASGTYFTYYEDRTHGVYDEMLAVWDCSNLAEGKYLIEVEGYQYFAADATHPTAGYYLITPPGSAVNQSQVIYLFNGYPHSESIGVIGGVEQFVTFNRPQLTLTIDPQPGELPSDTCRDFAVGDTVTVRYSVTDHFFGAFSVGVPQIQVNGTPKPSPAGVGDSFQPVGTVLNTNGLSGVWTFNTGDVDPGAAVVPMFPCGYNVELGAYDRAVLYGYTEAGHYNVIRTGFCLRAAEE